MGSNSGGAETQDKKVVWEEEENKSVIINYKTKKNKKTKEKQKKQRSIGIFCSPQSLIYVYYKYTKALQGKQISVNWIYKIKVSGWKWE